MDSAKLLDAYTEHLVVDLTKDKDKDKDHVSSIYAHGDRLFLGLASGDLLLYTIDDPYSNIMKAELVSTHKNFAKKSIDGLGAIRDAESLVVLSDSVISLYDLNTYTLNETLAKTKGAKVFAIYEGAQIEYDINHDASSPGLGSGSGSGSPPRYYAREELQDQSHSSLNPAPLSAFVSRLAVACRRKLICYEWKDAEFADYKEILLSDKIGSICFTKDGNKVICGLSSDFAVVDLGSASVIQTLSTTDPGVSNEMSSFSSMSSYIGIGGHQTMSSQLYQDSIIIIAGTKHKIMNGKWEPIPDANSALTLHESPKIVDYCYPYFICIFTTHVEIRNAVTMRLYQSLPIDNISTINTGKAFYVAGKKQIFKLLATDLRSQVNQLADKHLYTEAVSLLTQIESVLVDNKQELLRELQTQRAVEMFKNEKYDQAMDLFSEISASPDVVIALFPPPISTSASDEAQANFKDISEDLKRPVRALRSFLAETRRKISTLAVSNIKVKYQGYELSEEIYGNLDKAADLVDTCLFKCYMLTSPALVGPLVRVHNHCDPAVVTKALTDSEKWSELIDFYYGKSMHLEALDILTKRSKEGDADGDSDLDTDPAGPDALVRYLQKLDNKHLDLVLKFAKWPLSVDQDKYGEQIFMDDSPESLSYDKHAVLKYLMDEPKLLGLAIKYLEYLTDYLNDTTTSFHNNRILLYLKDVDKYGDRLVQFMARTPIYYRPERVLQSFPSDPSQPYLIEALAILHGHRGDHRTALKLYAFGLCDPQRSRLYCSRIYDEDPDMGSSALHILLALYLDKSPEVHKQDILDLLSSQGSRMSILDILSALPASLKVGEIKDFLHSHLRMITNDSYNEQLHSSLYKVHLARTEETHLQLGLKHTVVTNFRTCKICKKRLGYSVIAIFPDNVVVHYGCSNAYSAILEKQKKPQQFQSHRFALQKPADQVDQSIS